MRSTASGSKAHLIESSRRNDLPRYELELLHRHNLIDMHRRIEASVGR